jgi:hypothetical protein
VSNPLKPGFSFKRDEGEPFWIFLKYERLDVYCTSCGRISHKLIHYLAPPRETFPQRYCVSLHVNIFSNLHPNSPLPKINHAISQSQPSSSQTRSFKSIEPTVPYTQPHLTHTRPLQQKISQNLVPSTSASSTLNELNFIPSTAKTMITPTYTSLAPLTPQQPHMLPTSQPQLLIISQPQHSSGLNQETYVSSNQNQPSLSIVLPFNKVDPLFLASIKTTITNPSKLLFKLP